MGDVGRLRREGTPRRRTGKFGSNDIQVSLAYVLSESLTGTKEYKPGERSSANKILLILLKDIPSQYLDQRQVKRLEGLMALGERFSGQYPQAGEVINKLSSLLAALPHALLRDQAKNHATRVTKSQDGFLGNALFLHPTHSQLSKDHDDHPLHVLAANMAMGVVAEVGGLMAEVWASHSTVEKMVQAALKYFVHPEDIQDAAADRRSWLFGRARQWAKAHPEKVQLLEKGAIVERQFTEAQHAEALIRSRHAGAATPEALLARMRGPLHAIQGLT